MKKLRYVCAQPATYYYRWQVEVLINNFISMGVNPNDMDIVCWKVNGVIPDDWIKLANSYIIIGISDSLNPIVSCTILSYSPKQTSALISKRPRLYSKIGLT